MTVKRKSHPPITPNAGRPSLYTTRLAEEICQRIAAGSNLNRIAGQPGMPTHDCLYRWLREKPEFKDKYDAARQARADARAERMDDYVARMLTGELDPKAVRVALQHEQWQAGREAPKRYGDRLAVEAALEFQPVEFVIEVTDRSVGKKGQTSES